MSVMNRKRNRTNSKTKCTTNLFLNFILEDEPSSSSSDDESDEENEIILQVLSCIIPNSFKTSRVTVKNYVEEVVPNYSEPQFISHFRMRKALYMRLVEEFKESHIYSTLHKWENSRLNITPEKHVLTFLWFAGHQTASFRDVADRFDLALSSLFDVIQRVVQFLIVMLSDVIKLPNEQDKRNIKHVFSAKGFPNALGAVDGSHIKIDRPRERPVDYFNRKDFHSMILQGVCDHNGKFIDIFVGYPGSVHDARIFRNSPIYERLADFCGDDYILGDSAYPISRNLITPYRDNGHLTRNQKRFNQMHSSCRVIIEHAFGKLKQRFRQLYHLKLIGPLRTSKFITACCILHNLCIDDGVTFDDEEEMDDIQPDTVICPYGNRIEGSVIRDALCRKLSRTRVG